MDKRQVHPLYFLKKIGKCFAILTIGAILLLITKPIFANDSDLVNCGRSWRIVILGSSTAYGTGASTTDSSWVSIFRRYVKQKNSQSQVFNLGIPGYRTYQNLRPDGYIPPANRPSPSVGYNITAALALNADAIIINMPSNDAASNYTIAEQQANFEETFRIADSAKIPIWVTTTQPRNLMTADQMQNLKDMRQWIIDRFGDKSVNFWDGIANPDGTVASFYYFDNVHVNNRGHEEFFKRMRAECILDSLCKRYQGSLSVNAGPNQNITLPANQFVLQGSAISTKGNIVSQIWSQLAGPSTCQLNQSSSFQTNVTGFIKGLYRFQLTVNDDRLNTTRDTIEVLVSCGPSIQSQEIDTVILCANQIPYLWQGESISNAGLSQKTILNQFGCDSILSVFLVINPCNISIGVKFFIEGFLNSNSLMNTKLFNLGLSQDSNAVDSIQINLWKPSQVNAAQPDYSRYCILKKNGMLTADFPSDLSGRSFYISLKHKNSMEIWSSDSLNMYNGFFYDFSDNANKTYSNSVNLPQKLLVNGAFGLYGGDMNQDGTIDLFDIQETENQASNFEFGEQQADCNGDGVVDLIDLQIVENNSGLFIFVAKPF